MHTLTQYEVAWNMHRAGSKMEQIALTLNKHRSTVYRWLKAVRLAGIKEFIRLKKTCKQRRPSSRTPEYIAELIVSIRNQLGYCGFKIQKELKETHGISRSLATIYRILHANFTKHAVGVKKYKKHQVIVTASGPRQLVEHDTVDLGGKSLVKHGECAKPACHKLQLDHYHTNELYAHTSIDVFTKEPTVTLVTDLTERTGAKVYQKQHIFYGKVKVEQSDNGSEFGQDFVAAVAHTGAKHRYSRPYKKNEQAHIENFNKALRSECFPGANYSPKDITILQKQADEFTEFYISKRWHMGLPDAMTPAQFKDYYQTNPESATIALTTWQRKHAGKCRI
jgi:IS30 family transposase